MRENSLTHRREVQRGTLFSDYTLYDWVGDKLRMYMYIGMHWGNCIHNFVAIICYVNTLGRNSAQNYRRFCDPSGHSETENNIKPQTHRIGNINIMCIQYIGARRVYRMRVTWMHNIYTQLWMTKTRRTHTSETLFELRARTLLLQ